MKNIRSQTARVAFLLALLIGPTVTSRTAGADSPTPQGKVQIELVDGTRLDGEIIEMKGGNVLFELGPGARTIIPWAKVRRVGQVSTTPGSPPMDVPGSSSAPPSPSPPPPAAPPTTNDAVLLKDGTRAEGKVLDQQPGKYVTIRTTDGAARTFAWDAVSEVIARSSPLPPALAEAPAPVLPAPQPSQPAPASSVPSQSPPASGASVPPDVAQGSPRSPDSPASGGGLGAQRITGLVLGGVGITGLIVGSYFGLQTSSDIDQQKSDCGGATQCANYGQAATDHSRAQSDGTISTIAFVAGGVLLGTGGILFLTGEHSVEPGKAAFAIAPSAGPHGGGLWLRGEF